MKGRSLSVPIGAREMKLLQTDRPTDRQTDQVIESYNGGYYFQFQFMKKRFSTPNKRYDIEIIYKRALIKIIPAGEKNILV